jgi:hypothetical protein
LKNSNSKYTINHIYFQQNEKSATKTRISINKQYDTKNPAGAGFS